MKAAQLSPGAGARWGAHLVVSAMLCGLATTSTSRAAQPSGQAVSQSTPQADGQNTWIIEQEVRRTPMVPGLDPQLPPHVDRRLSYAFDLAQRGATYSAAGEFQAVLGLCALELDARDGGISRREALRQGLIALDEADQFGGEQLDWRESADVRNIAAGHATPVIRQQETSPIDSIQAVQAYYSFAEERLTYACAGLQGASLAYYGMGRTISVPASQVAHRAGKAVLHYRVALNIAPQNVLAGNELAVLLAQHGQLDEAQRILQHCVAVRPSVDTYRNLAVVQARRGDQRSSQAAMAAGEALAAHDLKARGAVQPAALVGQSAPNQPNADKANEANEQSGYLPSFRLSQLPSIFRR